MDSVYEELQEQIENKEEEEPTVVTVSLDAAYPGDYQCGTNIPASVLNQFKGDIAVTLDYVLTGTAEWPQFACVLAWTENWPKVMVSSAGDNGFTNLIFPARMNFTRRNMLEWTTASEADKLGADLSKYTVTFFDSIAAGGILVLFYPYLSIKLLGILWIIFPFWSLLLSKKKLQCLFSQLFLFPLINFNVFILYLGQ